jgi:hypothetical protein
MRFNKFTFDWRARRALGNLLSLTFLRRLAPCLLLAGCVSDNELLAENSTLAMQMVRQRASSDLGCTKIRQTIRSEQEEPGQPLGELDSEYHIRAEGCGKAANYVVLCGDPKLCYFHGSPQMAQE